MVDIEHDALRAFKQDAPAKPHGLLEPLPRRLRIGEDLGRNREQVLLQLRAVRLRQVEAEA